MQIGFISFIITIELNSTSRHDTMRQQMTTSNGAAKSSGMMRQLQLAGLLSLALVIYLAASPVLAISADQQDAILDRLDQLRQQQQQQQQQQGPFPLVRQLIGSRFRRQAARHTQFGDETGRAVPQFSDQLSQQEPEQQQHQQLQDSSPLENEEQILRRQLPDLIAQAHTDKTIERALLRLLINVSLRSGLSNIAGEQQQQQQSTDNGWQLDSVDNSNNNLAQYNQANSGSVGKFVPIRLTRLEQSDFANLDPQMSNGLGGGSGGGLGGQEQVQYSSLQHHQQRPHQFQSSSMDKREYIKPCSFNAISCVRTPFRRLIESNRAT